MLEHGADDLRDDVAGALDDDGITDADILEVDNVLVVERGELDGDAGNLHGLEHGEGVERAGATDVDTDQSAGAWSWPDVGGNL